MGFIIIITITMVVGREWEQESYFRTPPVQTQVVRVHKVHCCPQHEGVDRLMVCLV